MIDAKFPFRIITNLIITSSILLYNLSQTPKMIISQDSDYENKINIILQ